MDTSITTREQAARVAADATAALMHQMDAFIATVTDFSEAERQTFVIAAVTGLASRLAIGSALLGMRCVWGLAATSPAPGATADGAGEAVSGKGTSGAGESVSGPSPLMPGSAAADAHERATAPDRARESDVIGQLARMLDARLPLPKAPDLPA